MSMATFQQRPISEGAAVSIATLLNSVDEILASEVSRIKAQATPEERERHAFFPGLPEELRWRVMVLGSSVEDLNFWVRKSDEDPGGRWYVCTEIETGTDAGGVDAREAIDNYFKNEDVP